MTAMPALAEYTIDELARSVELTVRTTRYYTGRGLLPAPLMRGRIAYYDEVHRARLLLIKSLQEHGFVMAAIERYLSRIPHDATPEALAIERALLTSWSPPPSEELTAAELDVRAGRLLGAGEIEALLAGGVLEPTAAGFVVHPGLEVGLEAFSLGLPLGSMASAGEAIRRCTDVLAAELVQIFREQVLEPYQAGPHSAEEDQRFEQATARLSELTLDALVGGFRRATNLVVTEALIPLSAERET